MKARLVMFCGRAGAGKSTAAGLLAAALRDAGERARVLSFADPLRRMLSAMGVEPEWMAYPKKEESGHPLLMGRTPRWALQTLGTEWGRRLIGEDIWANHLRWRAEGCLHDGVWPIVDDCRFPNEAALAARLGGVLARVERPGRDAEAASHESEAHAAALPADRVVRAATPAELIAAIDALAAEMMGETN